MIPHRRTDNPVGGELILLIQSCHLHVDERIEASSIFFGKRRAIRYAIPVDSRDVCILNDQSGLIVDGGNTR
jgi:hypothetical protein